MPQDTLKEIVNIIFNSNDSVKYTKTLNGYFFNMNFIDESVLMKINDVIIQYESQTNNINN